MSSAIQLRLGQLMRSSILSCGDHYSEQSWNTCSWCNKEMTIDPPYDLVFKLAMDACIEKLARGERSSAIQIIKHQRDRCKENKQIGTHLLLGKMIHQIEALSPHSMDGSGREEDVLTVSKVMAQSCKIRDPDELESKGAPLAISSRKPRGDERLIFFEVSNLTKRKILHFNCMIEGTPLKDVIFFQTRKQKIGAVINVDLNSEFAKVLHAHKVNLTGGLEIKTITPDDFDTFWSVLQKLGYLNQKQIDQIHHFIRYRGIWDGFESNAAYARQHLYKQLGTIKFVLHRQPSISLNTLNEELEKGAFFGTIIQSEGEGMKFLAIHEEAPFDSLDIIRLGEHLMTCQIVFVSKTPFFRKLLEHGILKDDNVGFHLVTRIEIFFSFLQENDFPFLTEKQMKAIQKLLDGFKWPDEPVSKAIDLQSQYEGNLSDWPDHGGKDDEW